MHTACYGPGNAVECPTRCLHVTVLRQHALRLPENSPRVLGVAVMPRPCPLWVLPQHSALTVASTAGLECSGLGASG